MNEHKFGKTLAVVGLAAATAVGGYAIGHNKPARIVDIRVSQPKAPKLPAQEQAFNNQYNKANNIYNGLTSNFIDINYGIGTRDNKIDEALIASTERKLATVSNSYIKEATNYQIGAFIAEQVQWSLGNGNAQVTTYEDDNGSFTVSGSRISPVQVEQSIDFLGFLGNEPAAQQARENINYFIAAQAIYGDVNSQSTLATISALEAEISDPAILAATQSAIDQASDGQVELPTKVMNQFQYLGNSALSTWESEHPVPLSHIDL